MSDHLPVRSTDPGTSYAAAAKAVMGASRIRPIVLDILRTQGPMTHDQLIAAYHMLVVTQPDTKRSSESGIRTRLKELRDAGLVRRADTDGMSNYGNKAILWEAVDPDDFVDPCVVVGDPDDPAHSAYLDDDEIFAVPDNDVDPDADVYEQA